MVQSLRRALLDLGFEPTADPTLFIRRTPGYMAVIVYVDDLLFAAATKEETKALYGELTKKFKSKEIGYIDRASGQLDFLGRIILREKDGLSIGLPEGYWKSIGDLLPWKGGLTATMVAPDVVSLEKKVERINLIKVYFMLKVLYKFNI